MGEGRDWALGLLLGASLEDKLRPPPPGPVSAAPGPWPAAPGRPPGLGLAPSGVKTPFPALSTLDAPKARGQALHSFANHELLAIELMALALLRYSDVPDGFRQGLVRTIVEEQAHLKSYLARMANLEVNFGEQPLSGSFWRILAGVESPLSFVAAMSLTLEQANLDYAVTYGAAFQQVGDAETAKVLQVIRDDEIRHVAHGVKWWAALGGGELDLGSHRRALPAGLTLRRAKGLGFDRDGRRRAGLSEAYADGLEVHHDSRAGRPRLWLYRPGTEDLRAGRRPEGSSEAVAQDLAPLLLFVAGPEDVVELPASPDPQHLARLLGAGFPLPERGTPAELKGRRYAEIAAFGEPTPEDRRSYPAEVEGPRWPDQLYDKRWAATLLADYRPSDPHADLPDWARPQRVESLDQVEALRSGVAPQAEWMVVKAPLSASGRHRVRLPTRRPWSEAEVRTVVGILGPGPARAEAWLERVLDLSVQLSVGAKDPLVGLGAFLTSAKGQYLGHHLGPLGHRIDPAQHRRWRGFDLEGELQRVGRYVARALADRGFVGPAGVDAFLYRRGDTWALHPLVEVNPRLTMGHVAKAVEAQLTPHRSGRIRFVPAAEARTMAVSGRVERDRRGRIRTADLWLTDPSRAQKVAVHLAVPEDGQA